MKHRDKAVELLTHYLKLAAEHGPAYLRLNSDSIAEIGSIIDETIAAAVEQLCKEIKANGGA